MKEIIEKCKGEVSLYINQHRSYYQTAEDALAEMDKKDLEHIPQDVQERMKKENTIIRLQLYPDTPIGFYVLYDVDLENIITRAKEILNSDE